MVWKPSPYLIFITPNFHATCYVVDFLIGLTTENITTLNRSTKNSHITYYNTFIIFEVSNCHSFNPLCCSKYYRPTYITFKPGFLSELLTRQKTRTIFVKLSSENLDRTFFLFRFVGFFCHFPLSSL